LTLTFANNTNTQSQEVTITRPQPGNNFIAAAVRGDKSATLAALKFRDDGVTLYIPTAQGGINVPSTVHSTVLTVWRTLWVESDHMVAPGENDGPFTGDPNCNGCDDDRNSLPANPTIDILRDLLSPIFVAVIAVPAELDTQDNAPFKHYQVDYTVPTGLRNVQSSQYYWAVHMLGAYEYRDEHDNDPDTETPWYAGWSPKAVSRDDPTNFVFYETARDVWAEPEIGGGVMVPVATGLDRISAHEALHVFFGWHGTDPGGAADEGIMDGVTLMTAGQISLTNRQIKIIQSKAWPR
jgi:hypothetical protein